MTDLIALARTVVGAGPDVATPMNRTPRSVPAAWNTAGLVGIGVGVLSLAGGLATQTDRTLGVLLTCIVYFFGVALGGVLFSVVQTVVLARWGRPFKRIAESFSAFLPVLYVLWALFLLGGGTRIYEWTHEPMHGHKAIWLAPGFFIARQLVLMGFLSLLGVLFVRNSLRPDMGVTAEAIGAHKAPAWWGQITQGWKGRAAEVEAAYRRNIALGPIYILAYAVIFTLFAVDAVMSLAPHWYANMFPAWIFVSSFWLAINWICIVSVMSKKWLDIEHLLQPKNYHDLGKMMFALSIFWTYTFYAQLLAIWYGNMPEETGYLLLRLYTDTWSPLAKVVFAMNFVIPFTVLLSRGIKKLPESLVWVAMIIATGVFLERFLLVMPQVWREDSLPIGPVEIGVFIGFISAFLTIVLNFLARVPPVPVSDPFMHENPSDVHVHSLHAHDDHGAAHAHGGHGHGGHH